jgi:chromosome segregation ATPase
LSGLRDMQDSESTNIILRPNLQIAIGKIWELLNSMLKQMQSLSIQNSDLKFKLENISEYPGNSDWSAVENYIEENNSFRLQIEELNNRIKEFEEKNLVPDLTDELHKCKEELNGLKHTAVELEIAQKTIAEKNLIISSKNDEINDMKAQISLFENKLTEYSILTQNINAIETGRNELENKITELSKSNEEKNWIIKEFENSLNLKTRTIESINARIIELESQEKTLLESLSQKENDFLSIRDEKEKIEAELTKMKITSRELTNQVELMEDNKQKKNSLFDTHTEELEHFKNEKEILVNQIKELNELNHRFKNDLLKTRSGMLPINFDQDIDLKFKVEELESQIASYNNQKKYLENKLNNLENLLILKSVEIEKLNNSLVENKEEYNYQNSLIKSKILDLKKVMLDKGII